MRREGKLIAGIVVTIGAVGLACGGAMNMAAGSGVADSLAQLSSVEAGPERDAVKDLLVAAYAQNQEGKLGAMDAMSFSSDVDDALADRTLTSTEVDALKAKASAWSSADAAAIAKHKDALSSSVDGARDRIARSPSKWNLPEDLCVRLRNLGYTTDEGYADTEDKLAYYNCTGMKDGDSADFDVYVAKNRKRAKEYEVNQPGFRDGKYIVEVQVTDGKGSELTLKLAVPPGTDLGTLTSEDVGKRLSAKSMSVEDCEQDSDEDGKSWDCTIAKDRKVVGSISWYSMNEGEVTPEERELDDGTASASTGKHAVYVTIMNKKKGAELLDAVRTADALGPKVSL